MGGIFKADEAAVRVYGGNGSRAAARADVHHHRSFVGIGLDEILVQLHGLLHGMDADRHRWYEQQYDSP